MYVPGLLPQMDSGPFIGPRKLRFYQFLQEILQQLVIEPDLGNIESLKNILWFS